MKTKIVISLSSRLDPHNEDQTIAMRTGPLSEKGGDLGRGAFPRPYGVDEDQEQEDRDDAEEMNAL